MIAVFDKELGERKKWIDQEELLDYLDSAKLCRLKTFRIIHGEGTGTLRKLVQDILAKDRSVDSFRYGMPSEGGTGATVVMMKD